MYKISQDIFMKIFHANFSTSKNPFEFAVVVAFKLARVLYILVVKYYLFYILKAKIDVGKNVVGN